MKLLPVLLLLLCISVPVSSFETYVSSTVHDEGATLSLKDFISIYPDKGHIDLNRVIPLQVKKPALLSMTEIRQFLGTETGPVVLVGKRPVFIPSSIVSDREKDYYIRLLNHLRKVFPDQAERLEIESNTQLMSFSRIAEGPAEFEVGELFPGMFHLYCSDGKGNELTTTVEYARFRPVYVSKHFIRSGSEIPADSFELKMKRLEHVSSSLKLVDKIETKLYAVRNIPAGVVVLESYVSPSEIVNNGTRVTIIIEKGSFKLQLAGRTVEKAALGTPVRVKPIRGTKEIVGLLVEKDVVAIEY